VLVLEHTSDSALLTHNVDAQVIEILVAAFEQLDWLIVVLLTNQSNDQNFE
jgi:hypothetical protein